MMVITGKRLRTFFLSLLFIVILCIFISYQILWQYRTEVVRLQSSTLCKIPLIDPHSKSAKILIEINGRFDGSPPCIGQDNKFTINYKTFSLIREKANDPFWDTVNCCYKTYTKSLQNVIFSKDCYPVTFEATSLPIDHQNLDIKCFQKKSGKIIYRDQLPVFRPNPQIESEIDEVSSKVSQDRFSVLILGLDSVSHQNFVRYMPKTYEFLRDDLTATEYFGFNKVGSGTIANVIAMLSGCRVINPLDPPFVVGEGCELIWSHFIKSGYRTIYMEDGDFNEVALLPSIRSKSKGIGTHYNLSDFMYGVRDIDEKEFGKTFEEGFGCWQNQFVLNVFADPIIEVATAFANKPYFNFVWFGKTGHAVMSNTKYMDEPVHKILSTLKTRQLVDNTIIVIVGDHGPWHGAYLGTDAGALERLMPVLFVYFPPRFKQKYKDAYANIKINSKRLTAQYDLHATLMHLLHLDEKTYSTNFGQSLFSPVPLDRNCDSANIPTEYCMCWTRSSISNPDSSDNIQAALTVVLLHLNSELRDFPMCTVPLTLKSIKSATKLSSRFNNDDDEDGDKELIEISFNTDPFDAEFQATVRLESKLEIIGQVLRTNVYKGQSDCIAKWKNATYAKTMCFCT